jgi:beta-glucosidase
MTRNIKQLIGQMTLEEKASLCTGADAWRTKAIERLDIPSIRMSDGPHGLRIEASTPNAHLGLFQSEPATCFPPAVNLASTWNRELISKIGIALGEECQTQNVSLLLGPGANIKRSPLCGRNFEYFSEDPYLSSHLAASYIKGVQSQGVGTSLKHFAANNQEHKRMSINAVVDERTLREIYLASFEYAVKEAQPWSVMSAYNRVNGAYASENEVLLTKILKEEWGHEGFVVSDWGAVDEIVNSLIAGMELEMPSSNGAGQRKLVEAMQSGRLSEAKLNEAVERLLNIILKAAELKKNNAAFDVEAHHALACQAASESIVLLKNEEDLLPLGKDSKVAVIGEFAINPRYQGGGSSKVTPTKLDNILEEIEKLAVDPSQISYSQGYEIESDSISEQLIQDARKIAAESEVAVIFVGLPQRYESESYDRKHLRIPDNQVKLLHAVAEVQQNIVLVLSNGAPVEMPWLGHVKALLEAYLGGQALGGAIANILFGEINPSGKLAETFPQRLEHNPSQLNFPGEGERVEYKEGLFVGYRYYDAKAIEPLFPFGFGLSYTTFHYSNLVVSKDQIRDDEQVTVTVDVKNTGARMGKEIVQLYVRDIESKAIRPVKELKGFAKIELQPEEVKSVSFTLDKRSFAYYNIDISNWHVESGEFELLIGGSSRDIAVSGIIYVESTNVLKPVYHRNSTVGELMNDKESLAIVTEKIKKHPLGALLIEGSASEMMQAVLRDLPLRGLEGDLGKEQFEIMLKMINN